MLGNLVAILLGNLATRLPGDLLTVLSGHLGAPLTWHLATLLLGNLLTGLLRLLPAPPGELACRSRRNSPQCTPWCICSHIQCCRIGCRRCCTPHCSQYGNPVHTQLNTPC